jgi:hypothetical protein
VTSTTFLFTTFCISIQNFGALRVQTVAQQNKIESAGVAPGSVPRCRARAPRRLGVCASAAPPEATHHPSPCTFPRSTRAPRRSKPVPRHALARHPHRTTAGRVPHGPAVCPRLSSLVRRTTAEVHHLSSREQVSFLFKRSPSRASTELAGRHCRSSPSSPLR